MVRLSINYDRYSQQKYSLYRRNINYNNVKTMVLVNYSNIALTIK